MDAKLRSRARSRNPTSFRHVTIQQPPHIYAACSSRRKGFYPGTEGSGVPSTRWCSTVSDLAENTRSAASSSISKRTSRKTLSRRPLT